MYYLSTQDIQTIVDRINKDGKTNATVVNKGQLEFALAKPQMQIRGYEIYPELYQKAATLMEGLTKIHALSDGNKRCAMWAAEFMIKVNGAELVLPLKTIRLSVDTAMDGEDTMTKEIQQWFKVHTANSTNQLGILLEEKMAEVSIIDSFWRQKKIKEADDLLNKWMVFDNYPEHKSTWEQLKKWRNQSLDKQKNNQASESAIWEILGSTSQYGAEHPSYCSKHINRISDLDIVCHTLEELIRYEKTIKQKEKLLINTKNIHKLFYMAHLLENFGRIDEALEYQKRILKIDPTQDHAYFHMGQIYEHIQDYRKSIENFNKCIDLNPADSYVHRRIAIVLMHMNKDRNALKEVNESIRIKPEESESHYLKSLIQARLADFDGAKKSINLALSKQPMNSEYLITLGRILSKIGEYNGAIETCQKAVNIEPESIMHVYHLAGTYYKMDNYDKAIKYYDKILQMEPNNLETLINMGGACSNKGEYKKALQYLERGLAINQKHKIGLINMGITLSKMQEYDEAIKYLDQSMEVDQEDIRSAIIKSSILVKQNKIDYALELMREIIKKQPDAKEEIRNNVIFTNIQNSELFKKLIQ